MKSLASFGVFMALLTRVHSDIVLIQPPAETVRPGASVTLTCKTSGFNLNSYWMHLVRQVPGKGLQWLLAYYSPSSKYFAPGIQNRFIPSKDGTNNMFSVEVSRLQTDDTAVYYCARRYSATYTGPPVMDYWGGGTMLTVTAAGESAPIVYPLLSCEQSSADETVTFGCLAKDYSPVGINVYWKKDEANITTGINTYPAVLNENGSYTRSSELTVSETQAGSSAIYCVVQHKDTVQEVEMPPLEVHHPTIAISVSSPEDIRRSRRGTAVCSITDFQPAKFTVHWLKDGQSVHSGVVTSPAFKVNGNFSATSQLTFAATDWFAGVVYTCQVTHKDYTQSRNISNTPGPCSCEEVQVEIQEPPVEQVLLEASVTLTCVITNAPYGVQVSWMQGKLELKSEIAYQPGNSLHSVISNLNISTQSWLSGVLFECVVSHEEMPTPKRAYIRKEEALHPQQPSVSVLLPPTSEETTENSVILTCLVKGFSPSRIFVTWTVEDTRVDSRYYTNTAVAAENGNNSFFMYSLLYVRSEQWLRGASFSCVVAHESLPMKTIARTVNRSSEDIGIEDYGEDTDNLWTTASTFIILFFLSISYSAALSLVKVK